MRGARGSDRPGTVLAVTSLTNPRIKAIRSLALAKQRRQSGLFLGEGLKLVTDALEEHWPIDTMVHAATVATQPAVARAAAAARARGTDILQVSEAILAKLTRRDNPQTVLGVFAQRFAEPAAVRPGKGGVWVALEEVRDPGNLGTIIRTVDAVGADGVILVGATVDPYSIEAVRATMGSVFHVPLVRMSLSAFSAFRAGWPGLVVGTHLAGAEDYRLVAYRSPVLLLMGPEQRGLSDTLAAACHHLVRIPQAGKADSLNLAVATAVMLYEVRRNALKPPEPAP